MAPDEHPSPSSAHLGVWPGPTEWQKAAAHLFREAFEGRPDDQPYTWFVQEKEGIFDALNSVDAEGASERPDHRSPTIAAHAYHLLYILRGANVFQGRPAPEGDWASTWAVQEVSPAEWRRLKERILEEYLLLAPFLETAPTDVENGVIGLLAQLPHVAYHLGAMRALLRVV